MNGVKIIAAIVAAVVLVFVVRWLASDIYPVQSLAKPAYKVPGVTEPLVDLAALRRRWPQALESPEERVKLMTYMREMPKGAVPGASPTAAAPKVAAPEAPVPLEIRLARADVAKGERSARKCAACHTLDKGGPVRVGPNLWGIVGRPPARAEGFDYSDAMKAKAAKTPAWTFEEIDNFIVNPQQRVPGTRMTFTGLPDQQERADVIAYLRTLSDNPLPLPRG